MSSFELGYREPFYFAELVDFFRGRQLQGVESAGADSYARTARILTEDGEYSGWVRLTDKPEEHVLVLEISESLEPASDEVIKRIRRQFDLDCDPHAVHEALLSMNETVDDAARLGTRLPGCFEPFETCTRAILGQQVSVAAANKLAARITEAFGAPIETGIEGLTHTFPTYEEVARIPDIEDAFGKLGVIQTRSRCIKQVAEMVAAGELTFDKDANVPAQMERLMAMKGIGPWTANYIAMRAFSYPDAFLEGDVGIKRALPGLSPKERLALAERWRPWRSYANMSLWNSLSD